MCKIEVTSGADEDLAWPGQILKKKTWLALSYTHLKLSAALCVEICRNSISCQELMVLITSFNI